VLRARVPRIAAALMLLMGAVIPARLAAQTGPGTQVDLVTSFDGQSLPPFGFGVPNFSLTVGQNSVTQDAWNNLAVYDKNGVNQATMTVDAFFAQEPQPAPPPGQLPLAASSSTLIAYCPTTCPDTYAILSSRLLNPSTSTSPNVLNISYIFDNDYNLVNRTIGVIDPSPLLAFLDTTPNGFGDKLSPPRVGYNTDRFAAASTLNDLINEVAGQTPSTQTAEYDTTKNLTPICQSILPQPGWLPVQMAGAPSPSVLWFVRASSSGGGSITILRADPVSGGDCFSNSATFSLPVPAYSAPPLIAQPDPVALQLGFGAAIQAAFWRDNRLEVAHTVSSSGDGFSTAHVRWYEIDTSGDVALLIRVGEITPPPLHTHTFAPAFAINTANEIGLVYMESSATEFPSMYVTGKDFNASDFAPAILAKAGLSTLDGQIPQPVGDFSAISVDPSNDSFWATAEWGPVGPRPNGATTIANFSVQTAAAAPAITGFSPPSGPEGTQVTISGSGFAGASSVAVNGIGASFTVVSNTQINAFIPPGATTGLISVVAPGGTAVSSNLFTVTLPVADLSISKSAPATVTPGGSFQVTLTVTNKGPSAAPGVTVEDLIGAGHGSTIANLPTIGTPTISGGTGSVTSGGLTNGDGTVFSNPSTVISENFSLGTLQPGDTRTLTVPITQKSNNTESVMDLARIRGNVTDPNPVNNSAAASTTVIETTFTLAETCLTPVFVAQSTTCNITATPLSSVSIPVSGPVVQDIVDGTPGNSCTLTRGGCTTSETFGTAGTHSLSATAAPTTIYNGATSAPFTVVVTSALAGNIIAKSGPQNARVWTLSLQDNSTGVAKGTAITSFTLAQTFGAACTPVIDNVFPLAMGDLASGQTGQANVTIDFTGCAASARFTARYVYSANGGVVSGSVVRYNQYE
jgi:uncharacterized repeat protein (TIGR01451 family)